MHPILNGAIAGWQLSGIHTNRSGEFLRFGAADWNGPIVDSPGPNAWFDTKVFGYCRRLRLAPTNGSAQRWCRVPDTDGRQTLLCVDTSAGAAATSVCATKGRASAVQLRRSTMVRGS
jgi:hypothetical protein